MNVETPQAPSIEQNHGRQAVRVLLVEDNPGDIRLICEALNEAEHPRIEVDSESTLMSGLKRLSGPAYDVVLLDLSLPDAQGLDGLQKIRAVQSDLPVVVLTGLNDQDLALQAVKAGAQDYLVKGHTELSDFVTRALLYAIERHRMLAELRNLSLTDDLTGLYNRRGFMALAEQQIRLAERERRGVLMVYLDIDNMKSINDTHGHLEGDQALRAGAQILGRTFRHSDIVARVGGDEFAVLAVSAEADSGRTVEKRLQEHIAAHNRAAKKPYNLSFSVGISTFVPGGGTRVEDLLSGADRSLYAQKRAPRRKRN